LLSRRRIPSLICTHRVYIHTERTSSFGIYHLSLTIYLPPLLSPLDRSILAEEEVAEHYLIGTLNVRICMGGLTDCPGYVYMYVCVS
jgi:hypothetical protein